MFMANNPAVAGYWDSSFSTFPKPLMQMAFGRPRAIRLGSSSMNDNIPPHLENRFTKEQLESLFQEFPASYGALASPQKYRKKKMTTMPASQTSTTTVTTTTTTTTTTPQPPSILPRRRRPLRNGVPKFYYGGIEGREDYAVGPAEDDAVVLLVGLFNLLAIVVYTASKFVMGEQGSLSDRVIQWQVQKVLDELVIKVHSSQYVANLLSRAMPPDAVTLEEGRRVKGQTMSSWIALLQQKLKKLSMQNSSNETTEWLSAVKNQLMREIGSSPAAMSTVRLHPQIYKPLKQIYMTLSSEDGMKQLLENVSGTTESGRSLTAMKNSIPRLLGILSQLRSNQIQSLFETVTALGYTEQKTNILPLLIMAMKSQSWLEGFSIGKPPSEVETARVISESDSFAQILADYVAESYRQPKQQQLSGNNKEQHQIPSFSRPSENMPENSTNNNEPDNNNGDETDFKRLENFSNRGPMHTHTSSSASSQLGRRQGVMDDKSSEAPTRHWTDRWFSLLTQLSPVGLDITTLYARARARPKCLRALLCRANNAWRQVGPVQASLTPFTSVLVSWLLEDTMPHSLGDSLIAVRAGWMGKDCSILYPECPLHPDPHPAAKEAISFFSRLQFAATAPPDTTEGPSGPNEEKPDYLLSAKGDQATSNDGITGDDLAERVDAHHIIDDSQNIGSRQPYLASDTNHHYSSPTPQPQFQHPDDNLRPAYKQNQQDEIDSDQLNYPFKDEDFTGNAATLQAYYNRYKGKGPMVVPGSQYSSKYGHFDDEPDTKDKLYDKYDSPSTNSAEGEISGSNSVSGMALQDRPTGNNNKVWEEFFKAGLYGGIVPQNPLNKKEESSANYVPEKSIRMSRPKKRPMLSSLNKIGALLPDQPGFYVNPGYNQYSNVNIGSPKPNRPLKRPYFTLRPKRPQTTGSPLNGPNLSSVKPSIKKYKYGLRRGLPATNVNGYNAYVGNSGNLYQRQKPWYSFIENTKYRSRPTPQASKVTTTKTTTVSTTGHPLASKDIAPFGPEDAVTDVLRNELLYEYIRDRQGSIPIDDK